jgi:hypothetical protein
MDEVYARDQPNFNLHVPRRHCHHPNQTDLFQETLGFRKFKI